MDGDRPSFEAELKKLAAQSRSGLGPHPTPEQLTAYHAGELPEDEEEQVRDHVALCHDCADLLLDLADFSSLEAPEGESLLPSDADVDAAWKDLRARLQKEGRPVETAQPPPAATVVPIQRKAPVFSSLRFAYGLAATFLVAAVGLGAWNAWQARQPQLIPLGEYLEPIHDGTRSGPDGEDALVFSREDRIVAGLPLDDASEFPLYEAEIVERGETDDKAEVLWRSGKSRASRDLGLDLPPGFLKPGRYVVQLYGLSDDRREKVGEFALRIADSP